MATHCLQYVYQGFNGFRWAIAYYASSTATATQFCFTFWEVVDILKEYDFNTDYALFDGASTNRSFMKTLLGARAWSTGMSFLTAVVVDVADLCNHTPPSL